jgi:hypothetical protein
MPLRRSPHDVREDRRGPAALQMIQALLGEFVKK